MSVFSLLSGCTKLAQLVGRCGASWCVCSVFCEVRLHTPPCYKATAPGSRATALTCTDPLHYTPCCARVLQFHVPSYIMPHVAIPIHLCRHHSTLSRAHSHMPHVAIPIHLCVHYSTLLAPAAPQPAPVSTSFLARSSRLACQLLPQWTPEKR